MSEPRSLSWIDTLSSCRAFGYTDYRINYRCAVTESPNMGEQFVSFRTVVSFHIDNP